MRRLAVTASFAALALPTTAAASNGVVLTVNAKHHAIEIVDSQHVVHGYSYSGRLPKLHAGSRVRFTRKGGRIRHVHVVNSGARSVAFLARVVRSSASGAVFQLGDGTTVHFSSAQLVHHRKHGRPLAWAAVVPPGGISINLQGLEPGVTVLVTETVGADGSITITITLPSPTSPGVGGEQAGHGDITEVDSDAFVLTTDDGSDLRLHMAVSKLADLNLQTCDAASVTYHQDGDILIADSVNDTGPSSSSDCVGDDQDVVGAITDVSDSSITISVPGHGSMTFRVNPDDGLTDGFAPGDVVDVSYYSNGDGTYGVDDIEYVDQDVIGVVTAVSDGSLTITDDGSGQSQTFTADPSLGDFDGISVGDDVDVYFYASTTQPGVPLVDWVDDLSTD